MTIELGLTTGPLNTHFAPLAALAVHYERHRILQPLECVRIPMKTVKFSPTGKLTQVFISMLAGCQYLSEANTRLKSETALAQAWHIGHFVDQSTLSRTLDALTLTNLTELSQAVTTIWRERSRTLAHDWRGYLWLDLDLSGLPCGKQAEGSTKGYFSGKKMLLAASWPV